LQKSSEAGFYITTLPRESGQEYFITAVPVGNETRGELFQRIADFVQAEDVRVIFQEVLGLANSQGRGMQEMDEIMKGIKWPVTWVEEGSRKNLYGTHLWAVSGIPIEYIISKGKIIGCIFEDDYARYCRGGNIIPKDIQCSPVEQSDDVFAQMEAILQGQGMEFSDVVRTWFYNKDILKWYDDFNKVRNKFFKERNMFEALLPASTGVGGCHASGAALVSGLWAMKAKGKEVQVFEVQSPLQKSALDYGSSFSRAVEMVTPEQRRLFISGTASIAPDGKTQHPGDVEGQIELTMKVIRTTLESHGFSWTDLTRATAYVKRAEDAGAWQNYLIKNHIHPLPVVVMESDICRDDLLFEIEMDAVQKSAK